MNERAHRLFNLYAGEGRQAFFFAALAFVLFFAVSLGWKLSDALFVIHLSADELPSAYACISSALIASVSLILYAYNRYTTTQVFYRLLLIIGLFYGLVTCALIFEVDKTTSWVWFVLKVCNHIVFVETLSCFWTFLDQYYHFQDAKRLYTLFNSSLYLGLTCTGLLIQTSALSVAQMFGLNFIIIVLILLVAPRFTKHFEVVPDDSEEERPQGGNESNSWKPFFKTLLTSRFAPLLMFACLISYVLLTTTEISYLSSFQSHFGVNLEDETIQTGSEEFTRFYGICLASVGLVNLVTGWFLYSRLVIRFGVNTLILITPTCLFATFSGWTFDNSLFFAILGFVIVESHYPVIEDNNFNLLLNAVPIKLKPTVRVLIESFSEPAGMLLSSILLSSAFVDKKVLGIIFSVIALSIAFTLRHEYYKAIFTNLKDHALHLHKSTYDWFCSLSKKERKLTEERLIQSLETEDSVYQRLAIESVFAYAKHNFLKRALLHTDKLSNKNKIYFLEQLTSSPFRKEPYVVETVMLWQDIAAKQELKNHELIAACDFYLAQIGLLHPEKAQYYLESKEPLEKGAAIIALQHSFAHQSLQDASFNKTVAIEEMQYLLESEDQEEIILGIRLLGFEGSNASIEILVDFLKHSKIKVARSAAMALQECLDGQAVHLAPRILEEIEVRNDLEFRINCFKALSKIGHTSLVISMIALAPTLRPQEARLLEKIIWKMGLKTIPSLVSIMVDERYHVRSRIVAVKILAQLSLAQLNAHLVETIKKEIKRAYFYFYYGHTLPQEYEGHDLTLLKEGLLSNFQSVIDFIIHLLGASKWIEDCELIAFSLRSKSPKITSQAIESLETCCPSSIFRLFYPLIGDLPLKEKLHSCMSFAEIGLDVPQVLEKMEETQNNLDLILATTWKYRLDLPNWRSSLRKQMANRQELFCHFAYGLLEHGG